jgi:hypothetical protein
MNAQKLAPDAVILLARLTPVLVLFNTCHTEPAFSGLNGKELEI